MFNLYLKKISKNNVFFLKPLKKNNILQNPVIFGYGKIKDLKEYKYIYLGNLYKKKLKLDKIRKNIEKNKSKIGDIFYRILIKEIKFIYKKIDFLKNVYDFEANKIDNSFEISYPEFDYDYYNKRFFGVTTESIFEDTKILKLEKNYDTFTKKQLIELLKYSKINVEGLKYKFGEFAFMSHSAGTLCIPTKKEYSLREIITLFFHEMTHFFRRYNSIRNYGSVYGFSDYTKIEEGFALYNEYLYGRKLIPDLKYNPYYDACFHVLLDKTIDQSEKKERVIKILSVKGFSREKSLNYYYRFYRYSTIGSNKFFLKDLIYTKGYRRIRKILKENPNLYDSVFSGRVGNILLKEGLCITKNNFDTKTYFEGILEEIKNKLNG